MPALKVVLAVKKALALRKALTVKKASAMMVNKSSVLACSAEEQPEEGSGTVLALAIIAALLVLILKSDEVRSMLLDIVRNALSIAGNTGLL